MTGPLQSLKRWAQTHIAGVLITALLAMAAQFISDHYGAPVMLMAILLAMPFNFLVSDPKLGPGIEFVSRQVLRLGVALLGFRISYDLLRDIGPQYAVIVALGTVLTIGLALLVAPSFGRARSFGFLTGGAVAICGASAALAIASLLPKSDARERDLGFTVVAVTVASTVAMIFYPVISEWMGFSAHEQGVFLGATIHDVAQVVGAGYSVSDEVGDVSTLTKLFRVTLLAPVIFIAALFLRNTGPKDAQHSGRPALLPPFIIAFIVFAILNSLGIVPPIVSGTADQFSRAFLVMAVAAVGLKTSLKELGEVGTSALSMVVTFTVFIAVVVALLLRFVAV